MCFCVRCPQYSAGEHSIKVGELLSLPLYLLLLLLLLYSPLDLTLRPATRPSTERKVSSTHTHKHATAAVAFSSVVSWDEEGCGHEGESLL